MMTKVRKSLNNSKLFIRICQLSVKKYYLCTHYHTYIYYNITK